MITEEVLQNLDELQQFIDVLKEEKVQSFLEIGSKFGGSFFLIGSALPGATLVSVDLPQPLTVEKLRKRVHELDTSGHDAHLYLGDSTHPNVVALAAQHAPYDACFIDANHTLPFVTKDWQNYGPMCRIVAFHDINWKKPPHPKKLPIEVPVLWNEIKGQYRHKEIILDQDHNGIGILWRT